MFIVTALQGSHLQHSQSNRKRKEQCRKPDYTLFLKKYLFLGTQMVHLNNDWDFIGQAVRNTDKQLRSYLQIVLTLIELIL
jgi:hypothetical protein